MKETFVLVGAVIGFITVVLGLIKAIIEFRTMKMKNQTPAVVAAAVKAEPTKPGTSKSDHIPEVAAVRKLIDKTWTRASYGLAGVIMSFLLSFIIGLHPDMRGFWWEVASYVMMGCGYMYIVLVFVTGRRAVKLHESLGSLEIIEVIPSMLARYRQRILELEEPAKKPNQPSEPTQG